MPVPRSVLATPVQAAMKPLARVLVVKLVVTALFWAAPLIFIPESVLAAAGLPRTSAPVIRLLGTAYAALWVGYALGLWEVVSGRRPTNTVIVGVVSNGGAGAYLLYAGMTGALAGWHPALRIVVWLSAGVALCIGLSLYWYGLRSSARGGPKR